MKLRTLTAIILMGCSSLQIKEDVCNSIVPNNFIHQHILDIDSQNAINKDIEKDYSEVGGHLYCNNGKLILDLVPSFYEQMYNKLQNETKDVILKAVEAIGTNVYPNPCASKPYEDKIKDFSDKTKDELLAIYVKEINGRYSPLTKPDFRKGRYLGNIHVHDNGAGPSNTDVCLTKHFHEREMVISFVEANSKNYSIYLIEKGKVEKILTTSDFQ